MRHETELWDFIRERLNEKESVVLMVVAESKGSSPGRPGFMMAVSGDDICGSIGGGVMEVSMVERAREILSFEFENDNAPIRQVHRKESGESSGMICSGEQSILFKTIAPSQLELANEIIKVIGSYPDKYLKITPLSLSIVEGDGPEFSFSTTSDGRYEYLQRLGNRPRIDIVGGGHCALALSELMSGLGFFVEIFDDRPGLNTLEKNRFADKINIVDDYESIGGFIQPGHNKYVAVMTIGFKYDKVVIRQLLGKEFKYLGVLGSKAKMAVLLRELNEEGFSAEMLETIHTPIGIDINSRTPEEIAVSIAAEIIKIKNGEKK